MKAIYEKELHSFFSTMHGYVYTAFMLLIIGILFTAFNLQGGIAEFGYTLGNLSMVLLVVIPIITMRALGEERRQKTDQLLMTAPVSARQIVLGKFFAIFTVFSIPILLCTVCPLILSRYGTVPLLESYACFPPFLLMGAACISVGLFISGLTENQILSAVGTFGVLLLSYLIPSITGIIDDAAIYSLAGLAIAILLLCLLLTAIIKAKTAGFLALLVGEIVLGATYLLKRDLFNGAFSAFLSNFALFSRYEDFVGGIFSLTHIVYYCSVILLFLFLTVQSLEIRRWN